MPSSVEDNAAARAAVLARIRTAQGLGGHSPSQAEREAVETYVRAHPRGPLPPVEDDVLTRFIARAASMQSTTEQLRTFDEAPAAAARYLRANAVPLSGCVWPSLARLAWAEAGLELSAREARGEDAVGVTACFAALAETGTLMMVSGPHTPGSVSLLPETHIAIVPVSRIVKRMEDGWALARAELGRLPRLVNFISGPSRTGDIDQTIVLGAHGPYRVHMLLVHDSR
jgi:L-lactate dehydrogenase complex protein LldG